MPIVFSAIVPHPPLLIPTIGKTNVAKLEKTASGFFELERQLYASHPDTVIIISMHGGTFDDAFTINLSDYYLGIFKDFGDHSTQVKFGGDHTTVQHIRSCHEFCDSENDLFITLNSQSNIDYGVSVPLFFLMNHLKHVPIIPVYYPHLDNNKYLDFGTMLYRRLNHINKRFAIIASADLSRQTPENTPEDLMKENRFDKDIMQALDKRNSDFFNDIKTDTIHAVGGDGIYGIMILLGLLNKLDYTPEHLSYERPFGVGYLVSNFHLA